MRKEVKDLSTTALLQRLETGMYADEADPIVLLPYLRELKRRARDEAVKRNKVIEAYKSETQRLRVELLAKGKRRP